MKRNTSYLGQSGFGHVELLVGVVFVAIIGFVGVRVVNSSHAATPIKSTVTQGTPSQTSTLFGSTISSASDLATKTSQFGHMPIVRVYYPGLPSADAWSGGLPSANNSAVIVSFKALPATILSGADDATLTQFFNSAPSTYPIYYSYYHEPEDNIATGQFTAADYRAAWTHIATLADNAHNPSLHATLTLMAYTLQTASHRNWENYMPSGNVISDLAWDDYPAGGVGLPEASYLAQAVSVSKSAGLPFGFAEFNSATASNRGAWLTSLASYMSSNGALFGTLYDSPVNGGLGGSGTFVVSDADSIAAWHTVVQNSSTLSSAPSVSIMSPTASSIVKGIVTIRVSAGSGTTKSHVVWDGNNIIRDANAQNAYGWGSRWDTTKVANGIHTISVTAYNAQGFGTTATVTVNVKN
jgi:hypothetical protein